MAYILINREIQCYKNFQIFFSFFKPEMEISSVKQLEVS